MTERCPSCAAPILATASGLLDPDPTRLGVLRADGSRFTSADVIRAGSAHRGFVRHECGGPAPPVIEQGELFAMPTTGTTPHPTHHSSPKGAP